MYVSINVDEMMGMNWHLLSPIAPHLTLTFSLFDSMWWAKTVDASEFGHTLGSAHPHQIFITELQGMTQPRIKDNVVYHTDGMVC
jgi:hypothetical protein